MFKARFARGSKSGVPCLAAALILGGCSGEGYKDSGAVSRTENRNSEAGRSSDKEESDSSPSTSPEGDAGDGGSCESFEACGGDIVGRWNVTALCTDISGLQDTWTGNFPDVCDDTVIGLSAVPSELVFTYDESGQQTAVGSLSLTMSAYYTGACLLALYSSVEVTQAFCEQAGPDLPPGESCEFQKGGCACEKSQSGPINSGEAYEIVGQQLIQGDDTFDYCVQGNTLRILEGRERPSSTVYVAKRL